MPELAAAASSLLSLVLLAAGAAKLRDHDGSAAALGSYPWIPRRFTDSLAWAVPIVECALAIGLWIDPLRRVAALGAMGMLTVFTVVMIQLVPGGGSKGCGCFGSSAHATTWFSVARNVVLIGSAAIVFVADRVEVTPPAVLTGAGIAALVLIVDLAASALATTRRA